MTTAVSSSSSSQPIPNITPLKNAGPEVLAKVRGIFTEFLNTNSLYSGRDPVAIENALETIVNLTQNTPRKISDIQDSMVRIIARHIHGLTSEKENALNKALHPFESMFPELSGLGTKIVARKKLEIEFENFFHRLTPAYKEISSRGCE